LTLGLARCRRSPEATVREPGTGVHPTKAEGEKQATKAERAVTEKRTDGRTIWVTG
jgi:hypothetical protein